MKYTKISGSYDLRYTRGSRWLCPTGHVWNLPNVTINQARQEGLHICRRCKKPGKGTPTKYPV